MCRRCRVCGCARGLLTWKVKGCQQEGHEGTRRKSKSKGSEMILGKRMILSRQVPNTTLLMMSSRLLSLPFLRVECSRPESKKARLVAGREAEQWTVDAATEC